MEPVYLSVLVGIGVYVLVIMLLPKKFLRSKSHTSDMLHKLESETTTQSEVNIAASVLRDQNYQADKWSRLLMRYSISQPLYHKLAKAGLVKSIDRFFAACLVALIVFIYLLYNGGAIGVISAFSITALGAWFYLNRRISKRNQAFISTFPDALDMIVRSVRSGYPLDAAIRMVSENMQAPVSTEFKQVIDETAYGSSLIDALKRLSSRIDEPDIHFFVVVLTVQQDVGGNLAEVLSNLSALIRKRKHLYLKIKSLSSEGRATAWVLGLLPVFEFLAIYFVSPAHLTPLFVTPLGNVILLSAVGIVLLGVVIVRKMINIEV